MTTSSSVLVTTYAAASVADGSLKKEALADFCFCRRGRADPWEAAGSGSVNAGWLVLRR